jgi:effector-binding domain-containing protein
MADNPIVYKKIEPVLIASRTERVDKRDEIPPLFETLRGVCGDVICGDPLVIFHGGAVKEGYLVEIAFPVNKAVEKDEVHTRTLEAAPALTVIHHGPHQTIRETILKIYDHLEKHAWTTSLFRREIHRAIDPADPEKNVTEVQVLLHEWDLLLAEGTERELGSEARDELMQGIETITPDSSFEDYTRWIKGALQRLDAMKVSEEQKCRVVSHCAHVFPQERIDNLRGIYEKGSVDDVLREMYTDDFWYEKPVRKGNVIYMRKNPFNPEGYEKATTPAERRKAYCHCPFVHPFLDEIPSAMPTTFCYCGAGWYRRLWEGILGKPVVIEHVETLLKGNDQCTMTITLPLELAGECSPDQ